MSVCPALSLSLLASQLLCCLQFYQLKERCMYLMLLSRIITWNMCTKLHSNLITVIGKQPWVYIREEEWTNIKNGTVEFWFLTSMNTLRVGKIIAQLPTEKSIHSELLDMNLLCYFKSCLQIQDNTSQRCLAYLILKVELEFKNVWSHTFYIVGSINIGNITCIYL
jgi:hypothetical protein